jgi:hypothetical protein
MILYLVLNSCSLKQAAETSPNLQYAGACVILAFKGHQFHIDAMMTATEIRFNTTSGSSQKQQQL